MSQADLEQRGAPGGQAARTAAREDGDGGKVTATPAALAFIAELTAEYGPIMFHQSGGCCDGSSPMCYPQGEFLLADHDVLLGEIGGAPFYIGGAQYEAWKHTDLIIDVVPGRGGMFSLDNGREKRFLTRSSICAVPPAKT
ncbi:acetaldehyde dehydrogenase [Bordetella genomosp. 10]|uniref:Acetaldehyde dehydrogenase n=1 Tax=Bordetella genomosp. 10 TaxID=1416804 RepID=A0A261S4K0_9BORD|nr:DUF779 domain-containing protein [Bordetella genomosp. 10]OZI31917.1 acetaldehyde dehydrogenase [Bordetella genomosp. 10]